MLFFDQFFGDEEGFRSHTVDDDGVEEVASVTVKHCVALLNVIDDDPVTSIELLDIVAKVQFKVSHYEVVSKADSLGCLDFRIDWSCNGSSIAELRSGSWGSEERFHAQSLHEQAACCKIFLHKKRFIFLFF